MDLKEEHLLGPTIAGHWYYRAKLGALRALIADLPPGPLLDVGAGSGFFARALLQDGRATAATCLDPGYPADRDEQVGGRPLLFRRAAAATDARLVLMMDVLEHVADDAALLRETAARVAPGARFLLTVPAFAWLWSGHDTYLEHHRRYTLPGLERVVKAAGLRVERGCYYYGAVLPLVAASRVGRRLLGRQHAASDMRPFGPVATALLDATCRAERAVFRHNRLGGLTVFARAVKP